MLPAADRILLIQDRRIGDVVLSTALLDDLAAAYPSAHIDFLVGAQGAPLLRGHPLIHEIVVLRRGNVPAMWREVRARRYDLVIDVQGNLRTAMIARASGAPVRAGWDVRGRGWMYTHRVPRERELQYVVRDRQRLLQASGIPVAARLPRLYLTAAEVEEGAALLAGAGAAGQRVGMLLSTREPAKNWPVAHYAELSRLLHDAGFLPVLLPGHDDEPRIDAFHAAGGRAHIAPLTGVRPLMAMIANCTVFLSADTGPAHIATALGVPRVTLYGPTSPRAWDPGTGMAVSLRTEDVSCAGCRVDRCVHANACMMELSPARVLAALTALLGVRGG